MSHPSTTKLSWWPSCRTLWGRENTWVAISGVLVAPTLEICQTIYEDVWPLRSLQSGSPSAIRPSPGLLHLLAIPSPPWASISMDFITNLLHVGGHDMVLVIIDQFSKMVHFVPCSKTISGEETTYLFLKNVVQLHGLSKDNTFDWGSQFISHL